MKTRLLPATNRLFTQIALIITFAGISQLGLTQHCYPAYDVVITGNTAAFENQSTADGAITGYNWTFGDGGTSTEQNPSYSYGQNGIYEVCMTVFAHNPDCHSTFCHHISIDAHQDTCHATY